MDALQPYPPITWFLPWTVASVIALALALLVSTRKGTILGPDDHRKINYATFMELLALSMLLLSIGMVGYPLTIETPFIVVNKALDAVGGSNVVPDTLPSPQGDWCRLYGLTLSLAIRLTGVGLVVSIFRRSLAVPRLYLRSLRRDTYVFSHLTKESLALAKDVVRAHGDPSRTGDSARRVSLCFASVFDQNSELTFEARECGAICLDRAAEKIVPRGSAGTSWVYVLMGDPEGDLHEALSLKKQLEGRKTAGTTRIYLCSGAADVEPLVNPQGLDGDGVSIRTVDYTQRLAEHILDAYPLFLASRKQVDAPAPALTASKVRVAIVGAGAVGLHFLRSGSWCAQIDDMDVSFDVIGRHATAHAKQMGLDMLSSEGYQRELAGEGRFGCRFLDMDALSSDYTAYLEEHADALTYCLVSLGDDRLTTQVAMQTSQILERAAIRRASSGEELERLARPLIVAVIRDEELTEALVSAQRGGSGYGIRCIGKRSDLYTYESLWGKERPTEYARRSTRAADLHRKYRLFAFVRASLLGLHGLTPDSRLANDASQIDWGDDFGQAFSHMKNALREDPAAQGASPLERVIGSYFRYLRDTVALSDTGQDDHEWLLRMEHTRWNAYMLSEGYERASLEDVKTFFGTRDLARLGNGHLHHEDFALLHPCIVAFDELDELDEPLEKLYLSDDVWAERGTSFLEGNTEHRLKLKDDRYL